MDISLTEQINKKQRELNELESRYNLEIEAERQQVLKAKSIGMDKSLYLLGFDFEYGHELQYREFHRVFKRELTNLLKPYTIKIDIHKPNCFDITGFFQLKDNRIYYFSLGDLRWDKNLLLIRTAKDFKDYTGGSNNNIIMDKDFAKNLIDYLNRMVKFDEVS